MAKKKIEKKVKKKKYATIADAQESEMIDTAGKLVNLPDWAQKETVITLRSRFEKLEQRIDNIVAAHERCKSLKGL